MALKETVLAVGMAVSPNVETNKSSENLAGFETDKNQAKIEVAAETDFNKLVLNTEMKAIGQLPENTYNATQDFETLDGDPILDFAKHFEDEIAKLDTLKKAIMDAPDDASRQIALEAYGNFFNGPKLREKITTYIEENQKEISRYKRIINWRNKQFTNTGNEYAKAESDAWDNETHNKYTKNLWKMEKNLKNLEKYFGEANAPDVIAQKIAEITAEKLRRVDETTYDVETEKFTSKTPHIDKFMKEAGIAIVQDLEYESVDVNVNGEYKFQINDIKDMKEYNKFYMLDGELRIELRNSEGKIHIFKIFREGDFIYVEDKSPNRDWEQDWKTNDSKKWKIKESATKVATPSGARL